MMQTVAMLCANVCMLATMYDAVFTSCRFCDCYKASGVQNAITLDNERDASRNVANLSNTRSNLLIFVAEYSSPFGFDDYMLLC